MKVIIVGAGLSGLSTAIALRKYLQPKLSTTLEIKVYDEADTKPTGVIDYGWNDHSDIRAKNQGAAISLQTNAFKVLRDLDPGLADRVYALGFPCRGFTWKTASNFVLGNEYLDAHLISRPLVIECLKRALPQEDVVFRTVTEVTVKEGEKPVVHFSDGGAEQADLVVGADGIRSPVRKSLYGEKEDYRPVYLGNCVVGGVLDLDEPLPKSYLDDPRIVFIHGSPGTFGYGGLSQTHTNKLIYFSFYDTDLPQRGEKPDMKTVTEELRKRHRGWGDPMIAQCLERATIDTVYPCFYMPSLPHWGQKRSALVGDAAHAMTSATGQGGSQAFEDGQTLALLLAANVDLYSEGEAIEKSIQGLFDIRSDHVYMIKAKGLAIKEPKRPWSWWTTALVYSFYFAMTKYKWLSSFFGQPVYPAHLFDAKHEVKKYVEAQSQSA